MGQLSPSHCRMPGARDRIGEQLHGVPGDGREQRAQAGGPSRARTSEPPAPPHRARGRGRGAGELVDAGEREVERPGVPGGLRAYQLADVAAQFAEARRARRSRAGASGVPAGTSPDPAIQARNGSAAVEPFLGVGGREEIQTDPPGVEPQLVRAWPWPYPVPCACHRLGVAAWGSVSGREWGYGRGPCWPVLPTVPSRARGRKPRTGPYPARAVRPSRLDVRLCGRASEHVAGRGPPVD